MPGNAEAEFQMEVRQTLERAFAEGHSVDNAAVELKTLRMASNVPLRRVREGVVAAIVEEIPVVEGDMVGQKREILGIVKRWGELIDRIGGVDAVETVSVLQVDFFGYYYLIRILMDRFVGTLCDIESYAPLWPDIGSTLSSRHCRGR